MKFILERHTFKSESNSLSLPTYLSHFIFLYLRKTISRHFGAQSYLPSRPTSLATSFVRYTLLFRALELPTYQGIHSFRQAPSKFLLKLPFARSTELNRFSLLALTATRNCMLPWAYNTQVAFFTLLEGLLLEWSLG